MFQYNFRVWLLILRTFCRVVVVIIVVVVMLYSKL